MGLLRREAGFWNAVSKLTLRDIFSIEAFASVIVGGAIGVAAVTLANISDRVQIAADYLVVVGALVGIVFAGMALVAGVMSGAYLQLLRDAPGGVVAFFGPFTLALGIQVSTVIGSVIYRLIAESLTPTVEHISFGVLSVCFIGGCLEAIVLARVVVMHALSRSKLDEVIRLQAERNRRHG